VLMTWRAMGLEDTDHHVIECHVNQDLGVEDACRGSITWRVLYAKPYQKVPAALAQRPSEAVH
jgi:hypothetical protein